MFSATWSPEINNLASNHLKNPLHIQIGNMEYSKNENIT